MPRLPRPLVLSLLLLASATRADDGDPDITFSDDGYLALPWPATAVQAETREVAIADDGSVLVASWWSYTGEPTGQAGAISLTRLRSDGTPDPDFGTGGTAAVDLTPVPRTFERPRALALDPDGRVHLAAGFEVNESDPDEHAALVRLRADGTPDTAFGTNGRRVYATSPWDAEAELVLRDAAIHTDRSAVFAFSCGGCAADYTTVLLRTRPDGEPDPTFDGDGWAMLDTFGEMLVPSVVAFAPDRGIVVAGVQIDPGVSDAPFVARWTAAGVPDAGFGDAGYNGLMDADVEPTALVVHASPTQPEERIFMSLTGSSGGSAQSRILALGADGEHVAAFGSGGRLDLALEEGTRIGAMVVDDFDRLLVAGTIDPNGAGVNDFLVVRTTYDGDFDPSFDGNGKARYVFPSAGRYDTASALALSPTHAVVAGTLYDNIANTRHVGVLRLGLRLRAVFRDGFEP